MTTKQLLAIILVAIAVVLMVAGWRACQGPSEVDIQDREPTSHLINKEKVRRGQGSSRPSSTATATATDDRRSHDLLAVEKRIDSTTLRAGAIRLTAVYDDGRPASRLRVSVVRHGRPETRRHAVTDHDGATSFLALEFGKYIISAATGDVLTVNVVEEQVVVPMTVTVAVVVRGVVFLDGKPLAGASIFSSDESNELVYDVVAESGSVGEFLIPSVSNNSYVWAVHPAYGRSRMKQIEQERGSIEKIVLEVEQHRNELTILAMDVESRGPVGGVSIALQSTATADGSNRYAPTQLVRTDENGEARWSGLASGEWRVLIEDVRFFVETKQDIVLVEEGNTRFEVHLQLFGSIGGEVRNAEGRELRGIEVRVVNEGSSSRVGKKTDAVTDESGKFLCRRVRPGMTRIVFDGGALGAAREVVDVRPGKEASCNVTLSQKFRVAGKVTVDNLPESVNLIVGGRVPKERHDTVTVSSDTTGMFSVEFSDRKELLIEVFGPRSWNCRFPVRWIEVASDINTLEIALTGSERPTSSVEGDLSQCSSLEGIKLDDLSVSLKPRNVSCPPFTGLITSVAESGRFKVADLSPGSYVLFVVGGGIRTMQQNIEVAIGQSLHVDF